MADDKKHAEIDASLVRQLAEILNETDLTEVVNHFRDLGGIGIAATDVQYVYRERCDSYDQLIENLARFTEASD